MAPPCHVIIGYLGTLNRGNRKYGTRKSTVSEAASVMQGCRNVKPKEFGNVMDGLF